MAAEEILPCLYGVRMAYVNAFLILADDGVTLIDSGLSGGRIAILRAIRDAGRTPDDLKHIAITHHHVDHTGSLAALAERTGAKTYVHAMDAPVVRGDRPAPGPNRSTLAGRLIGPLIASLPANRQRPARVDHELNDGDTVPAAGGLRAVHTPGHTAGHTVYLFPRHGGVLFVGDAAANLLGRLGMPLGLFTEDMTTARESIRKIAALEFDTACFGHGAVLKGGANARFRRLVEKLAR
jgi:glyoxylase-like metal-dependent hydrolase (beta-lactamase superfamily II)